MTGISERTLCNCVVMAIKYYLHVRTLTTIKSIFLWLKELNLFIRPLEDFNCTKNQNHSENSNISDRRDIGDEVDDKILWAD